MGLFDWNNSGKDNESGESSTFQAVRGLLGKSKPKETALPGSPAHIPVPVPALSTITPDLKDNHKPDYQRALQTALAQSADIRLRSFDEESAAMAAAPSAEKTEEELNYYSVDDLSQEVKQEAIDIAKDILDKLRLKFASMSLETLMGMGDMPIVQELMDGVSSVARTFKKHLDTALKLDPDLIDDPAIMEAGDVFSIFNYHAETQALAQMEMQLLQAEQAGNLQLAAQLRAQSEKKKRDIEMLSHIGKSGGNRNIGEMLGKLEAGLDKVVSRMQEMTQQSAVGIASNELFQKPNSQPNQQQERKSSSGKEISQQNNQDKDKSQQQQQQQQQNNTQTLASQRADKQMKNFVMRDQANDLMMEARRRRMLERQQQRREQQEKAQRAAARKANRAAEKQAQKQQKGDDAKEAHSHDMGNLLDNNSLKGIQSTLGNFGNMQVPDALMPNSAARMVKTIKNQRSNTQNALRHDTLHDQKAAQEHHAHDIKGQEAKGVLPVDSLPNFSKKNPQITR